MPSPIGHALAGAAIALVADRLRPEPSASQPHDLGARAAVGGAGSRGLTTLAGVCVALATLPDADLLLQTHRTVTHSIGATALVLIVAAAVTGWVTRVGSRESGVGSRKRLIMWLALTCGAAHASHMLLDWMGADYFDPTGLQALWPLSDRFFISGWDVFARIERRDPFALPVIVSNVKAVLQEIVIMAPIVWAAWSVRHRPAHPTGDRAALSGSDY